MRVTNTPGINATAMATTTLIKALSGPAQFHFAARPVFGLWFYFDRSPPHIFAGGGFCLFNGEPIVAQPTLLLK
jgi:hypothetical protein